MSDITLYPPRNLPASPEDIWGGSQNTALGAYQPQNGQQQPQPLKKLNRLLRGRWLLALTLSAAGAVGGAMAGFKSQVPLYAGVTQVEIKPGVVTSSLIDKAQPYFMQMLKNESLRIPNERVISAALQRPEWLNAGGHKYTKDYVAVFQNNLTVVLMKDSAMIQITFQSENPKLAAAGANAVMRAYEAIKAFDSGDSQQIRLQKAQQQLADAQRTKHDAVDQMNALTKEYGTTELGPLLATMQQQRQKYELDLGGEELALENAKAVVPDPKSGNRIVPKLTPDDIAQFDPRMKGLLEGMQKATDAIDKAKLAYGPNHPAIARAQLEQQAAVQAVNNYLAEANKRYLGTAASAGQNGTSVVTEDFLRLQAQRVENYKKQITKLSEDITKLGTVNQQVQDLLEQTKRADDKINSATNNIDQLLAAGALNGQIIPQGDAIIPNDPAVDKRKQVALMGFVLGGGVPFGLMLLIGLLDSRYRYSDDTSDAGVNGLTLLGILPNLPDRLSDPGQASIAAHCVHQIRTMLQINSHMMPEKRAFSVTSASSGDGKTSLTLALGLSFAASGSRTLLIDSDLVGAGLTARLGMNGPEGILEAMTSGNLMEYVKQTDVSDLSILPVGLAQLHHAGIFSPQSVRRLVNEAKKHYEVILIDTGPILGSIEATPVAAASDGVILTVARGQQRPLVEKALAHLNSIGARVAGVVFNRAQSRDFEQSISGISMRSASRSANGNGVSRAGQQKDAGQYGPVARAVATTTSVKNGEPTKN